MSSTTPPPSSGSGEPEFLDPADGDPVKPSSSDGASGRRTALVVGGAAAGLALVGGAAWAAVSFLATGAQPAEALPDSTVGYASVDLDPSGGQKIEAFRMIQKFRALEKELDGLDADDDLLEKLFENVGDDCEGLDYADDLKPWLGKRFAAAAVDIGKEMPAAVGVIQVTDADAARAGLSKLMKCDGEDAGGWTIEGEWAVVAESKDVVDQVTKATSQGRLADDETYQKWIDAAGDPGVVSLYAAPEVGKLASQLIKNPLLAVPNGAEEMPPGPAEGVDEVTAAFEAFEGMAATLRFDEGSLELELAGYLGEGGMLTLEGGGASDTVGSLPEDTAAALGAGLPDGWFQKVLEEQERFSGGQTTAEDMLAQLEAQTGLTVEDVNALLGDSTAIALGSDFDLEAVFGSTDGSGLPVGAKVKGDADAVEQALSKLAKTAGPGGARFLGSEAEGDMIAIGPNADYRKQLLEGGTLGDSEVFQNVVPDADEASAILFVNFDAGDWLGDLARTDPDLEENLEPLQGIGLGSWVEDGASHTVLRLTTD